MKTKNEPSDWASVVAAMENGATLAEASRDMARLVRVQHKRNTNRQVSEGQIKAIRIGVNYGK